MYITSRSLRTIAYSTLAFSAAHASYVIDNLSFGHKDGVYLSPDLQNVPHWSVHGIDDYKPQVLSDRVILTPPYPGSKRGALWSNDPLHHHGEWTAELTFRANGMERGGGNLQLWYVKDSQAHQTPNSLYTAPKFDGLVLVIDQYEGHGGSVRGFLNDGSIDFKGHPSLDTLAFGKCDYAYRNRGSLSTIQLHHLEEFIEVLVDGQPCFKTNKVKLPDGYHFGISAASAENPDSFELFKFAIRTTNSNTREEPGGSGRFPPKNQQQQQQQQHHEEPPKKMGSSQTLQDVLASTIKSQDDQFADLHDRIQDMSHHINTMYEHLEYLESFSAKRHNELMAKLASLEDRTAHTVRTLENTERTANSILRDVESKDFKDLLNQVHRAIDTSHQGLSADMPAAMKQIVGSHGPSWIMFLCIAVAVQIMVTGAYILYKKRRNGAPKKYL